MEDKKMINIKNIFLVTFFEKVTNSQGEFLGFPQGFARAKREEKADG